ncbi:DUF7426 family protein [Streptomyces rubiginosohelvolus]|uniref:DUF7426 domain-containing protein n=1 Tax=Streptomyces rubiginosohelvolus TaxID=67362 RepID=A0ABQ3BN40_9ACTN|nr:hypothetical protein [Streptomyces pluricolorescens]GGZ51829.1 hypothetical protein GCM10010328_28160 [Streptomyces pluricolorescens]
MAEFEALDAYLDDVLELPVTGTDGVERIYRIEGPTALDGVRIEKITTLAARMVAGGAPIEAQALDDEEEIDLYKACLGSQYEPLLNEVSWARFKHTAITAMMWITVDRETAAQYWKTGAQPGKPNRAARRKQAARGSSAKGAASTTKPRASTSGTKTASQPKKPKKAAARS